MGFNVASGFVDKARQPNDENQKLNTIHPSCEADFFFVHLKCEGIARRA